MNTTGRWIVAGAVGVVLCVSAGRGWAQGSLTPPGPPAPTMKTLQQVEPRTPISSAPYTIVQSGSYYFTTNLTGVAGLNGIIVQASGVTIDLNGFQLAGVTNSLSGILISGQTNIVIRNGVVCNWGGDGVGSGAENEDTGAQSMQVLDLLVSNNASNGIRAGTCALVRNCTAQRNAKSGIEVYLNGTVTDCNTYRNGLHGINTGLGSVVKRCSARQNNVCGIQASPCTLVTDCAPHYNGTGIGVANSCYIYNNDVSGNTKGIDVVGNRNRIDGNNVTGNNSWGIYTTALSNLVIRNTASDNHDGDYSIPAGNSVGAILNVAGGVFTNSNPWANFSY